jgi:hypothetical protein
MRQTDSNSGANSVAPRDSETELNLKQCLDQMLNNFKSTMGRTDRPLWATVVATNNQPTIPKTHTTHNASTVPCDDRHMAPQSTCRGEDA